MKSTLYPSDWGNASLEEVSIHIIGGDWGKAPDFIDQEYESVACIRGAEFKNWKRDFGKTAVIRKVKCSSLSTRNLLENDILVEISGGGPDQPVGRTVLIDEKVLNQHKLPLVCTNFLRLVRLNNNINAVFVNRYLEFFYNSGEVTKYQSGSNNLRNLKFKDYSALKMPLPPLAEQKIIAEKLDTLLAQVDSTKARLEQIPQILKRFRQAVLAAAMRGELSETWRTHNSFNISLHKYYELTKGKKLKAKNIAEPCEENTWLRCNIGHIFNVKSGDGLTAKEMNPSGDIPVYGGNGITGYHDKYNTEESTIVIGRVGYYCGSVHLTPEKSWITDNALLVDFNRDLITEKFAYWLLKATNLRVDTSSSAQPVISGAKIYSIEIVVPPVEEQHEIVRRVEQLFAYADTIEKQVNNALARVNNLTQSILAKAFRGELTAQWRAENPELISGENSAAALLEKIKAERAASGGKKASRKKS
ncbi:TPA: restriction endonuclease subunit S [Escherichia coli]|uniref:restriction endonuclease subunit S n=1 Tax=Escherichia ruysiae TaxID=2608867 RepID=UPI002570B6D7|nr:restriction endonuclease subunit S [Escherichia ruysiae]MEC9877423.1 restriction endonuclease subunit S [Escherichia ruysiae]MEC9889231.1 restriction endonuclease subunit S [Escherichia ruysiae]MED9039785.1 restriction endonuclease subunit S [Escherichia ruysiae]MED9472013.1 restriction endonuclease subunit S [Escherichia ruysiae]